MTINKSQGQTLFKCLFFFLANVTSQQSVHHLFFNNCFLFEFAGQYSCSDNISACITKLYNVLSKSLRLDKIILLLHLFF